ncbi:MAG: phosphocholine cytidylyltransferase family protein [Gemmatimonadota bacterium]
MQAVILAAGMGSRLHSVTGGGAKALVEIGGRPLILHQLEALADQGVGPVLVILGHEGEEVQRVVGDRATFIRNDRYAETNSLYSLWLARDWIKGPFVLLNCDLLFDPSILVRVLEHEGNVLAYDSTSSRGKEQTKVAIKNGRVMDIGKDLPPGSARGESLGMLKFEADGVHAMLAAANRLVQDGQHGAWVIEATRSMCGQVPLDGVNIAGKSWTEIDLPHDLDVARREVWPVIWNKRWATQVFWKRIRIAAVAAVALALAAVVWLTSTKIGPASVDWETVDADSATRVRIDYHSGTQRWWALRPGTRAIANVSGEQAAVEARLVLPSGFTAADSLRFVLGITIDGQTQDWYSLTATLDTTARLGTAVLSDRDRVKLELGPGPHRIEVELTAGHSDQLLVRIREPASRED